jgi:hypothetical protein
VSVDVNFMQSTLSEYPIQVASHIWLETDISITDARRDVKVKVMPVTVNQQCICIPPHYSMKLIRLHV